jgi:nitrogen fixation NifU-like protein
VTEGGDRSSSAIIRDHYAHPRNCRSVQNASLTKRGSNPLCGDEIAVSVRIGEAEQILDIGFDSRGCSILVASASMMTEFCSGHTLSQAELAVAAFVSSMSAAGLPPDTVERDVDALKSVKLYPTRIKCAVLPWATLRELVALYQQNA